jgi:hypothetical protein
MGSDQQVVAADRLSRRFQLGANSTVFGVGWHFERQHIYFPEQVFDSFEQSLRTALARAPKDESSKRSRKNAAIVFSASGIRRSNRPSNVR